MRQNLIALFLTFSFIGFFYSCSILPFLGGDSEGGTKVQSANVVGEEQQKISEEQPSAKSPIKTEDLITDTRTEQVSIPAPTGKADTEYVLEELAFEVKKLSAEVQHLASDLKELQAQSQMWMNPLSIYNKEIILKNGTSYYGKIIYQDEKVVKVETLIGYLVINRENIVRIVENIPEEPPSQYLPEGITTEAGTTETAPVPPPVYTKIPSLPSEMVSPKAAANCVLVGNIIEKKDRSGNTIFTGEIKNIGSRRADFVKINFVFRKNWSGDTKTLTSFVKGSYYTFETGVTSDASLLPGATGKFELIIPKSFGPYIGYSYSIDWEQYE